MVQIGHRFMTGQACTASGNYVFDGYTDASAEPSLTDAEKRIVLNAGASFPTASAEARKAFWKFVGLG